MSDQDLPDLRDAIRRVIQLEAAVGLAIGALTIIEISPHSFNGEGLSAVLKHLREISGAKNEPQG